MDVKKFERVPFYHGSSVVWVFREFDTLCFLLIFLSLRYGATYAVPACLYQKEARGLFFEILVVYGVILSRIIIHKFQTDRLKRVPDDWLLRL